MSETKKVTPFVVKVSYDYIPSINNYLQPRRGGGLMLTDEARAFKNTIRNCLEEAGKDIDWGKVYPWIHEDPWMELEIHFLFNQSFGRRDTSNCVKMAEDSLADYMEIDDHNNLKVTSTKFYLPSSPKEYIIFIYKPSSLDYMIYENKYRQDFSKSAEG